MKAFFINQYGNTPMQFGDLPEPTLGAGQVLVEIHAASVNPFDLKVKHGEFRSFLPRKFPLVLGNDFAGKVTQVSPGVTTFNIGDVVYGLPKVARMGTFAQRVAVDAEDLALMPNNLSMEQAAAMPMATLTSTQALVEIAQLKPGQKVLIHAGAGGVGSVAIQLAKHMGAFVATTTSTANIDLVKRLGADQVIDYKNENFENILQNFDVVLNSLDAQILKKSVSILKPGAHLISISGPPTPDTAHQMKLNWVVKLVMKILSYSIRRACKKAGVNYSFLFMQASGKQLADAAMQLQTGAICPVIDKVFTFDQVNEAMSYVQTGRAKGKVVIHMK